MSATDLPPPVPADAMPQAPDHEHLAGGPFTPPPSDWGALPVGAPGAAAQSRSPSLTWAIIALLSCVLSMIGAFLPILSVGDRSISRTDGRGIDVVVPWQYRGSYTGSLLFERWDVAFVFLLVGVVAAGLLLVLRGRFWPAAVGAIAAALAFHLQLSLVQRAELYGLQRIESPSYHLGSILLVGGAFLALVSFVVVLARRH